MVLFALLAAFVLNQFHLAISYLTTDIFSINL